MRSRLWLLLVAVVIFGCISGASPLPTSAQLREPPATAALYADDPLNFEGAASSGSCQTGRTSRYITGEGLQFRLAGKCTDADQLVQANALDRTMLLADAEARVEFKIASGLDRARVRLEIGEESAGTALMGAAIEPARGRAYIVRYGRESSPIIAERNDVGRLLDPNGWNSIAVRTLGPSIWMLVNDVGVIQVDDVERRWRARLGVQRLGDINDEAEMTVVFRNLRTSSLVGGAVDRAPQRAMFAPAAGGTFAPAIGSPPDVGASILDQSLVDSGVLSTGSCRTGRGNAAYGAAGYQLRIRGRCSDTASLAGLAYRVAGLSVPDGDLSVEFRVDTAPGRTAIRAWLRLDEPGREGLFFELVPWLGRATLVHFGPGLFLQPPTRGDIGSIVRSADWNTLNIRLLGDRAWVLINGQLAFSEQHSANQHQGVTLGIARLGPIDDEVESSASFRNLRVSAIAGGDPARAPTHSQPAAAPPSAPSGTPNCRIGFPKLVREFDGSERWYCIS